MREVSKEQVIAFRWLRHGLSMRLPNERWLDSLRVTPLQDSPPGSSMPVALAARVEEGPLPFSSMLENAWESGDIMGINSLRYAPLFFASEDFAAFTVGSMPAHEPGWRSLLLSIAKEIEGAGMDCEGAALSAIECMAQALSDGPMRHSDLCLMLEHNMPPPLRPLLSGMPYAASHLILAACKSGLFLLHPRIGNQRVFGLHPNPPKPCPEASERLARLYLSAYAPATFDHFAGYAGATRALQGADPLSMAWAAVRDACVEVRVEKKTMLAPEQNLPALLDAPRPGGLRLLPPFDAYLRQTKRAWLLPSPELEQIISPIAAPPHVIAARGMVAGALRVKKKGMTLEGLADLFVPLSPQDREELEEAFFASARARGLRPGPLSIV